MGWVRSDGELNYIESMEGWVSPRLEIRFETASGDLEIYRPDGLKFLSYVELSRQMEQERQEKELVRQKADRLSEKLREMGINPDEIWTKKTGRLKPGYFLPSAEADIVCIGAISITVLSLFV